MKPRNKGRISGPFVPMLKHTLKEPAWIALSHGARSLYVALKSRYNSTLGNAVYVSTRTAVLELGSHSYRDNVRRWFRQLQYYGFIVMVSPGHLGAEGRGKAPHWRLTEEWYLGQPPTRDYQRWNGEKFHEQKSPRHYYRRQSRLHTLALQKQNPGPRVQSTLDHAFSPPLDHAFSPPTPGIQAITSLTTPCLAERSGEHGSTAQADTVGLPPAPDGKLPWSTPVIEEVLSRERDALAPPARKAGRTRQAHKPAGIPPMSEMIAEALRDGIAHGHTELAPAAITEFIREKWWPGAPSRDVSSAVWRLTHITGRLAKADGRYRLNGHAG